MTVHVKKPATVERAYAVLQIKGISEDERVITGTATTPAPDRVGDIIEPLGVTFTNPMPLLWQHDSRAPVGTVNFDPPTKAGITFRAKLPRIAEPGPLKDRVDTAWGEVKAGLVRAVSIGFRSIERSFIEETGGLHFLKSQVLELSLVTIPANADANISTIKAIVADQVPSLKTISHSISLAIPLAPAAPGQSGKLSAPAGVTARTSTRAVALEGLSHMKTLAEQITALEAKRKANTDRMEAVMQTSIDDGRSTEAAEQEEFDTLSGEVETIDKDLGRLRNLERFKAQTAKAVQKIDVADDGSAARGGQIVVKTPEKLAPGILAARYVRCMVLGAKMYRDPAVIAEQLYGPQSILVGQFKTAVPAGTTISGNWGSFMVGSDTNAFADFAPYVRAMTILGKFGQGNIPPLRQVPFRVPLLSQTGGATGYWVGEGKAKPLTSITGARTTLAPLKVANIAVLSEENIRDSSPKSDVIIRDELARALQARLDTDFIDPSKTASSGVSPASITNGASTEAASGTDSDAVRLDVRTLMQIFINANNPPASGVWIMSTGTALSLSMMVNALGQPEFPGITMNGGTFFGMPVIASEYASDNVTLVNASDIYEADDGEVSVDMSREASLEMSDAPANEVKTPTAAQLVSMFQTNSVAIRAERTINWARRRTVSVAYLTSVAWGGAISL